MRSISVRRSSLAVDSVDSVDDHSTKQDEERVRPAVPNLAFSVGPIICGLISVVVWVESVRNVRPLLSGFYGLVTVLPPLWWVALALAVLGVGLALVPSRPATISALTSIGSLVVVLHGTLCAAQPAARFSPAYATSGFSSYIAGAGHALPGLDARMSWAGVFSSLGMLSRVAGVPTYWFLSWAPLVINFLYLIPVKSIANTVLSSPRARWAAVGIFASANWIGQDYLSPQAVNLVLYLAILALLLRVFAVDRRPLSRVTASARRAASRIGNRFASGRHRRADAAAATGVIPDSRVARPDESLRSDIAPVDESRAESVPHDGRRTARDGGMPRGVKLAYYVVLLVWAGASVISHQFTPAAIASALFFLLVFGRLSLRYAWLIISVFVFAWLSWVAQPFWIGHLNQIFGGVRQLNTAVSENVTSRVSAGARPIGRTIVQELRLVSALVIWLTAAISAFLNRNLGTKRRTLVVLLLSPAALLTGVTYGGEAALRALLLALPPAAVLIASLLDRPTLRRRWISATVCILVWLALVVSFPFTRYGNEKFEAFTLGELQAARYVETHIPRGGVLLMDDSNAPVGGMNVDRYRFGTQGGVLYLRPRDLSHYLRIRAKEQAVWFYFSRSVALYGRVFRNDPPGWMARSQANVLKTGCVQTIYKNSTAVVMRWVRKGRRCD